MDITVLSIALGVSLVIWILRTVSKSRLATVSKPGGGKAVDTQLFEQGMPQEAQKTHLSLEQDAPNHSHQHSIDPGQAPASQLAPVELKLAFQTGKIEFNSQNRPTPETSSFKAIPAGLVETKHVDSDKETASGITSSASLSPTNIPVTGHPVGGSSRSSISNTIVEKARQSKDTNAYYLAFKLEHAGLKLPIAMFFSSVALKLNIVADTASMTWFETFLIYLDIPEEAMPGGILENTETVLPLIEQGALTGNGGFFNLLVNMNELQEALFIQAFYKLIVNDSLYTPLQLKEVIGYLPQPLRNVLQHRSHHRVTVLSSTVSQGTTSAFAHLAAREKANKEESQLDRPYTTAQEHNYSVPFTLDHVIVPANLLEKDTSPYHIVFKSAPEVIRLSAGFFLACIVLKTHEQSDTEALQWLKTALYSLELPEINTLKGAVKFLTLLKEGEQSTRLFEPLNHMNNEQTIMFISLLSLISRNARESDDNNRNIQLKDAEKFLPPSLYHLIFSTSPSVIARLIKDVLQNPYTQSPGDHAPLERGGPPRGPLVPSKYPVSMFH